MNFVLVLILVHAAWKGWRKGLIMALFSLAGILLGALAAFQLSASVASYLQENTEIKGAWLPVLSFLLVIALVSMLVNLVGKTAEAAMDVTLLGPANKLAGAALYLVLYAFLISVVLFYGNKTGWIEPRNTGLAGILTPWAPAFMNTVGNWLPFFHDAVRELESYFERR